MSDSNGRPLTTADIASTPTSESTAQTGDERNQGQDEQKESAPLFPESDTSDYQERWTNIQARFVDEPQESVKDADTLVAEVMKQLAQRFAEEREQLEKQWGSGSEVSTEELRQALQSYRSFFQRLLTA